MTNLNENEMAATAARLWEPNQECRLPWMMCPHRLRKYEPDPILGGTRVVLDRHNIPAPDMRDPANLWRALENRGAELDEIEPIIFTPEWLFAALVALYKAEHPQDFDPYE